MTGSKRSVVVVGAGMVGLCVAWHLQEEGASVTVLEADKPNGGASWGNAGWVAPALTTPLPNPAVLRYGLRAMLSRTSPLHIPLGSSPATWRWLVEFARNSTARRWRRSQAALSALNQESMAALEGMTGLRASWLSTDPAPITVVLSSRSGLDHVVEELTLLRSLGQDVRFDILSADETQAVQPGLSERVHAGVQVHDQLYLDPTRFVSALAVAVVERGGVVRSAERVDAVQDRGSHIEVIGSARALQADHAILATGAALGDLARAHGVRRRVQAGRGYSFTTPVDPEVAGPLYFPEQRIACTPLSSGLRVAGMMEFRPRGAPLDRRRVDTLASTLAPMLPTARLGERTDEWVGARPCTADGLPLIGTTRSPRIHVAGGHGMWGIALGPITGRLLARAVLGADRSPSLFDFDPLR